MARNVIPSVVRLPRGFTVKVVQLPQDVIFGYFTPHECQECGSPIAIEGERPPKPEDVFGFWLGSAQTIYLNADKSLAEKQATLRHELLHAAHDWIEARF